MQRLPKFRILTAFIVIVLVAAVGYLIVHKSHAASADINADGKVDILDLSILASNFGKTGQTFAQGDINGDGSVNVFDLSALASAWGTTTSTGGGCKAPAGGLTIAICGNKFVNASGSAVVLRGVNTEGTQYDCAQSGSGFYDDSTITQGSGGNPGNYATNIAAMKVWGINAVRVNLNEQCWLGQNGVPATTSATVGTVPTGDSFNTHANAYMTEMGNYVKALNNAGIYAEIDLHLNAPGTELITDASTDAQNPLPEANSETFWKSVAAYFNSNHAVVFGVFNEPFPPNAQANGDTTAGWNCDISGCTVPDYTAVDASKYGNAPPSKTYAGVGMQALINDIRQYNTTAPLVVGGPDFAGDVDQWLAKFYPGGVSIDPKNQLGVSVHIYYPSGNSPCAGSVADITSSASCGGQIPVVAAKAPVLVDELGDFKCANTSLSPFIKSIDAADAAGNVNIGYVMWSWTTSSCDPNVITNYSTGAPSVMGEAMYCEQLNGLHLATATFSADCTGPDPK